MLSEIAVGRKDSKHGGKMATVVIFSVFVCDYRVLSNEVFGTVVLMLPLYIRSIASFKIFSL